MDRAAAPPGGEPPRQRVRLEVGRLDDRNLAAVLTLVSRHPPFIAYSFGLMVHNLTNQLRHGANVLAIQGGKLRAYAGWLRVDRREAEVWRAGGSDIPAERWQHGDAAIVTVVVTDHPGILAPLLRGVSHACAGVPVFRMRSFQDGRSDMRRPPIVGRRREFS